MISTSLDGNVATITLDRADRRNALTPEMLRQLVDEVDRLGSTAGAILLAGVGKVFCAGFDLTLCREDHTGEVMRQLLTGLSRAVVSLRQAPVPVVIAAHGAAIAGGCALLGGGDVVLTDRNAQVGYPVTRMGISPAVSAPFLRLGAGDGPCRERMLDCGLVSGRDAVRLGLAHECCADHDGVLIRAREIAASLAEKPRGAMVATKRWLNSICEPGGQVQLGLDTSLGRTGSGEERSRLAALWKARPG